MAEAEVAVKVAKTQISEAKSAGTEEAEKAVASEPKHEENNALSDDTGEAGEPKVDKLDELSSLEQEIAKMHNIQHCTDSGLDEDEVEKTTAHLKEPNGSKAENGSDDINLNAQIMDELAKSKRCTLVNKVQSNEESATTALEEVDLIALLKGTDQDQEQPAAESAKAAIVAAKEPKSRIELALSELDNVGVTIEGEGQYEIMEIDDGDNVSGPSPELQTAANCAPTVSKTGAKFGKPKLSPEQARAVALEQMADLKAQKARRKDQAPAPIKQQQPLDIISSLNDDWNEYDSGSDNASNSTTNANTVKKTGSGLDTKNMVGGVKVMLKSVTPKTAEQPKAAVEQLKSNSETTGFKRTRVIKRKIIWDPDVPESQKSFAKYASSKTTTTTTATVAAAVTATTTVTEATTTTAFKANHTEIASKKALPPTPKEPHKVAIKRTALLSKLSEPPPKRHPQTPSMPNGVVSVTKKKKVTEIDRLMGDEGAANMMQAVEREQRELSGGETANKPLMRKRSMTLTGRPQKAAAAASAATTSLTEATAAVTTVVDSTSAPSKKETPPKASKRAAANNVNGVEAQCDKATKSRASDSWDYVYKQRASEESMIMRRRSNSSYSSNASVSRLSLDNRPGAVTSLSDDACDASAIDPSFIFLKPENKANQRSDGSAPQTLTNDLKRSTQQQPKVAKVELVTVNKLEKLTHLVINAQHSKTGFTYKLQLLQKLNELLNKLAKAKDCNTVLLSVQGQQFCQGIDCHDLMAASVEKRKSSATQLAMVIKTYLRTLATFPKPLVAGIVGNLKNLGVMQLPLFDFVLAADDCSFETNYAKLGQLPEGYAFWQKHQKAPTQLHSRLFLLGERVGTADVNDLHSSFIDRICKSRNVNDEALSVAKLISSTTAEHYRSLKKLNQTGNAMSLQRLDAEFKIISEQWSSAIFQASYKRYINDPEF